MGRCARIAPLRAAIRHCANVLFVIGVAGVFAGCTPTHFRLRPQRDDVDAAQATAQHAAAACVLRRGEHDLPPYAFTSDGCSMWPDGNWVDCCLQHDMMYWCGGNAAARQQADAQLRACVADHGATCTGQLMYVGVRIGGIPWQPFPWRWAYGWSGIHGYDDPAAP
jgi:hypothetical protein